jgi:hypothetical protein
MFGPKVLDRRVGKSGAVCIAGLEQGTNVRVAQVRPGVYLVSPLPLREFEQIVEQMPQPAPSPFSALIAEFGARVRTAAPKRSRHGFTGIVEMPTEEEEAVLARASLQNPRRGPRS